MYQLQTFRNCRSNPCIRKSNLGDKYKTILLQYRHNHCVMYMYHISNIILLGDASNVTSKLKLKYILNIT